MVQKGVAQMSNRVSVEKQIEMGVLQSSNSKYVPAKVETQAITHRPTVEVMPPPTEAPREPQKQPLQLPAKPTRYTVIDSRQALPTVTHNKLEVNYGKAN